MESLRSVEDFEILQERIVADRSADPTIVISAGTCGQASGANDLIRVAKSEILRQGLTDRINLRITGCHGFCEAEPSVLVEPDDIFYPKVTIRNMSRIVEAVAGGRVVEDLLFVDPVTGERVARQSHISFFRNQVRTLLRRNQRIDPIRSTHGTSLRLGHMTVPMTARPPHTTRPYSARM